MIESDVSTTVHLERCLQRLGHQDAAARGELLGYARRRLALLADRMFARFSMLHFHEEADDLCQEAMIRLWKSLEAVGPTTVAGFMGLAALEMRRALRDLAREHFGRKDRVGLPSSMSLALSRGAGSALTCTIDAGTTAPDELACWSEFHAAADRLCEPNRTVFDLLYYHELPQAEVAALMEVSPRQVRRYWQSARRELHRMMEGWWPEL